MSKMYKLVPNQPEKSVNTSTELSSDGPPYLPLDFKLLYQNGFEIYLYGYAMPVTAVVTLFLNIFMLFAFVRKRMRNTTHVLLGAIAICDSLTAIFPASIFFTVFIVLDIRGILPYHLCRVWYIFSESFPIIFHSTSILLTVYMAAQRFICVMYPLSMLRLCTTRRTLIAIFVSFIICIIFEGFEWTIYNYSKVNIIVNNSAYNRTIDGCIIQPTTWIKNQIQLYNTVHFLIRVIGFKVLPCVLLFVFKIGMLRKIYQSKKWRRNVSTTTVRRKTNQEARLTVMTMWIVGAFLVVETPAAIIMSLYAAFAVTGNLIVPERDLYTATVIANFVIILTFPSNFVIYCCCSRQFRDALKETVNCSGESLTRNNSNIFSKSRRIYSQNTEQTFTNLTLNDEKRTESKC